MHKTAGIKIIPFLLSLALVLSLAPVTAQAASGYAVTVSPSEGGTITISGEAPANGYAPGETVTVKMRPDENYGYITDSLQVASKDASRTVAYEKTAPLTFSFTMPEHSVVLSASFRRKSTKTSYSYFVKQLKEGENRDTDAAAIYAELLKNAQKHNTSAFSIYPESAGTDPAHLTASTYDALAAFLADYPRFFWLYEPGAAPRIRANLESYGSSVRVVLQLDYNVAQAKAMDAELWEVVKQVVADATAKHGSDTYGKLLYFHDYIVKNTRYDINGKNVSNAYAILKKGSDKRAVCDGYAQAFKILCDAAGIPNVLVAGQGKRTDGSTEDHRWNYVQLNGKWYAVDTTWDDPVSSDGKDYLMHTYFLKGSKTMQKDHVVERQFITYSRNFRYPALEAEDYNR